jgi:uncharacterized protein affecting Mg2+/Co2+ transport
MSDTDNPQSRRRFLKDLLVGGAIVTGLGGTGPTQTYAEQNEPPVAKPAPEDKAPRPAVDAAEKKAALHCMQLLRDCQLENGAIDIRTQWNPKSEEDQAVAKEAYEENKAAWERAQAKLPKKDGEKKAEYPAFDPTKRDGIRVVSYFSNFAAMGMLAGYEHHTKDQADLERVAKWLAFYNKAQDPKIKIVPDYHGSRSNPENKFHVSDQIDSIDAYASTHLQLVERYTRLTEACNPANQLKCEKIVPAESNLKAAKASLQAIEACLKADGLTIARHEVPDVVPEQPVKYLMDNVEVYAGLKAGERYFRKAGATKEADRCKEMAGKMGEELKKYWQKEEKHFAWAIQGEGLDDRTFDTGLDDPYPHGMANQYGIAWVANGKEQKELWEKMQKDFKLNPDDHKVFDEAMPIARSYMVSLALKDGNEEKWRSTLLKQMEEMPASRNAHIVGIAMLTAMERGKWMDAVIDGPAVAEKKGPGR